MSVSETSLRKQPLQVCISQHFPHRRLHTRNQQPTDSSGRSTCAISLSTGTSSSRIKKSFGGWATRAAAAAPLRITDMESAGHNFPHILHM